MEENNTNPIIVDSNGVIISAAENTRPSGTTQGGFLSKTTSQQDLSQFGDVQGQLIAGEDGVVDYRQQLHDQQGTLGLIGKGFGRAMTTVGAEVSKMFGYMGGFALDVGQWATGQGWDMNATLHNDWLTAVSNADEHIKESWFPVHKPEDFEDMTLMEQLSTPEFWATEGADGVGFLVSFLAPGQALKALKVGKGATQALANAGKMSKGMSEANFLGRGLLSSGKAGVGYDLSRLAGNIDSYVAVGVNTLLESTAEGSNTFSEIYKHELSKGTSDEEAKKIAGEKGARVFRYNLPILLVSNFILEGYIMKGFNRTKSPIGFKRATSAVLKGEKEITKQGGKTFAKNAAIGIGIGTAQEGVWEEGMQTSAEQVIKSREAGDEQYLFSLIGLKWWDNISTMFNDNASTDAKQFGRGVVLGGVLGGGMSMLAEGQSIKQSNRSLFGGSATPKPGKIASFFGAKEKAEQKGLLNIFKENYTNTIKSKKSLFKLDENGNPTALNNDVAHEMQNGYGMSMLLNYYNDVLIQSNGDNKIAKTETEKLLKEITSKSSPELIKKISEFNENLDNPEILARAKMSSDMAYFYSFFQQEGGIKILKEHIDTMVEANAKRYEENNDVSMDEAEKAALKTELETNAETYHNIYQDVKNGHTPYTVKVDELASAKNPSTEEIQRRRNQKDVFLNNVLNSKFEHQADFHFANERLTKLQLQSDKTKGLVDKRRETALDKTLDLDKVIALTKATAISEQSARDFLTFDEIRTQEKINDLIDEYNNKISTARKAYKTLTSSKKLQELWEAHISVQTAAVKHQKDLDEQSEIQKQAAKEEEIIQKTKQEEAKLIESAKNVIKEKEERIEELENQESLLDETDIITKEELEAREKELAKLKKEVVKEKSVDENIPTSEPENVKDVSDKFEGKKPIDLFHTTGKNIKSKFGTDEMQVIIGDYQIPINSANEHQRTWFKFMDETTNFEDYELRLFQVDYTKTDQLNRAATLSNPNNQGENDIFAVVYHKNIDTPVSEESTNNLIITSIRKTSTLFPAKGSPEISMWHLTNEMLTNEIDEFIDRKTFSNNKIIIDDLFDENSIKLLEDKYGVKLQGKSVDALEQIAIRYGRVTYNDMRNKVLNSDTPIKANITTISSGHPVVVFDSEGKQAVFNPMESLKSRGISFKDGKPVGFSMHLVKRNGTIIVNGIEKGGYSPGSAAMYIEKTGQIVELQSALLDSYDIEVVLAVLEQMGNHPSKGFNVTLMDVANNLSNPFEVLEIGSKSTRQYSGSDTINAMSLIPNKENKFSLITTMINFGQQEEKKLSKYDIFISKGKVYFGDKGDNLSLADVQDLNKNEKLIDFLKTKRFHLNRTLLNQANEVSTFNSVRMEKGMFNFQKESSYLEYMFSSRNLTTTVNTIVSEHGLPQFAQRNMSFELNSLDSPSSKEVEQEVEVNNEEKTSTDLINYINSLEESKRKTVKEGYHKVTKILIKSFEQEEVTWDEILADDVFNKNFKFKEYNINSFEEFSDFVIKLLKPFKSKEVKSKVLTREEMKAQIQQRTSARKEQRVKRNIPDDKGVADKRTTTNKIINDLVNNNILDKKC